MNVVLIDLLSFLDFRKSKRSNFFIFENSFAKTHIALLKQKTTYSFSQ